MTTAKQTTKAKTKKTEKKTASRFHAVNSLHKTRENWIETVKDYNAKYITKPFENRRDFVVDVKKDPKRVFTNMVDGSKDLADGAKEDFFKAVESVLNGGRDFYAGMEKDTRKMLDDFLDRGKKITDRIPGKETMEKGISRRLESIPDRLNLLSKKDMGKLSKTVRKVRGRWWTMGKNIFHYGIERSPWPMRKSTGWWKSSLKKKKSHRPRASGSKKTC